MLKGLTSLSGYDFGVSLEQGSSHEKLHALRHGMESIHEAFQWLINDKKERDGNKEVSCTRGTRLYNPFPSSTVIKNTKSWTSRGIRRRGGWCELRR